MSRPPLKAFAPVAMQVSNIRFQMGRHRLSKGSMPPAGIRLRPEGRAASMTTAKQRHLTAILSAMALSMSVAATPAPAAPKATPPNAGYAVAEVRLGMSSEQVRAVARTKGMTLQDTYSAQSFREAVALATGRRIDTKTGIDTLVFRDAGGNRVSVKFVQTPDGPKAARITFSVLKERYSTEEAASEMTRRYGRPTTSGPSLGVYGTLWQWCAPASKCSGDRPTLAVFSPGTETVIMLQDRSLEAKAAAALKAAIMATPAAKRADF